jgi:hypothetical protein
MSDETVIEVGGWDLPRTFDDLGIGKSLGYEEIAKGRLPTLKIGSRTITTAAGRKIYRELLEREAVERLAARRQKHSPKAA